MEIPIKQIIIKKFDDKHDPLPKTYTIDVNKYTSIEVILSNSSSFHNGILEYQYFENVTIYAINDDQITIKPTIHKYSNISDGEIISEL